MATDKFLLHYGSTIDVAWMRENLSYAEEMPLDGFIAPFYGQRDIGAKVGPETFSFLPPYSSEESWQIVSRRGAEDWMPQAEEWAKINFRRLKQNFIKVNGLYGVDLPLFPAVFNWFDPFYLTYIGSLFGGLALAAREAGFRGVCFDPEPYGGTKMWDYTQQLGYPATPLEAFQRQAYTLGRLIKIEMTLVYPEIKILLFGSHAASSVSEYKLYTNFLDGLFDGKARSGKEPASICVTTELSYSCTDSGCLANARDKVDGIGYRGTSPNFVSQCKAGLSLFLDYETSLGGTFNFANDSLNYFTAALWESQVGTMLRDYTDIGGYSWIYSQSPVFWGAPNSGSKGDAGGRVPEVYLTAIRNARNYAGMDTW